MPNCSEEHYIQKAEGFGSIRAIQFMGISNAKACMDFADPKRTSAINDKSAGYWYLVMMTSFGMRRVDPFDWIIRNEQGHLFICPPEMFEGLFEKAGA